MNNKEWLENIKSEVKLFLDNREITFIARKHKSWPIFFAKIEKVTIKMKDQSDVSTFHSYFLFIISDNKVNFFKENLQCY